MYARIRGLFRFSDLDDITDYPIDLVAYILTVKKKKKFSMNRTELNIVSCSRLVVPLRALCGIHFRSLKLLVCADNPTVCCQFFSIYCCLWKLLQRSQSMGTQKMPKVLQHVSSWYVHYMAMLLFTTVV